MYIFISLHNCYMLHLTDSSEFVGADGKLRFFNFFVTPKNVSRSAPPLIRNPGSTPDMYHKIAFKCIFLIFLRKI